jgi:hypothetical protein
VLVSAVPSAGVGGPASVLGGPGIDVLLLIYVRRPSGEIHRGIEISVGGISATAGELPVGEPQIVVDDTALRAQLARWVPAVGEDEFTAGQPCL